MAKYKTEKNLIKGRSEYSRYYGGFRGVDLSNDHTEVNESRLAYSVNMYRDYHSGQGRALETVAGFRRRAQVPNKGEIYGIHRYKVGDIEGLLIHGGDTLYLWSSTADEMSLLYSGMNTHKSVSFTFNNRLYIVDGRNYIYYDGTEVSSAIEKPYIPTTYINIIPDGSNSDAGVEYEQRNILSPRFKHVYKPCDVNTKTLYLNERDLDEGSEVSVTFKGVFGKSNEEYVNESVECDVDYTNGAITLKEPVGELCYPNGDASASDNIPLNTVTIEVTAQKTYHNIGGIECDKASELITGCTIATIFDNRIFLSGNPSCKNHVFYCGVNDTGYVDPSYFGVLSYIRDGLGAAPIKGMLPVSNTLMILKGDTRQDGFAYFHTPMETGTHVQPKIYPSTQGLCGIGCLGACTNFLDDPVFISRLGVEGIGQLSIRNERAVEHRSSLIDSRLINCSLDRAVMEEWDGYLAVLVDGQIFLADSRQRYTHDIGVMQYEWYYLDGIGIYEGQYSEYRYSEGSLENTTVRYCTVCNKDAADCDCGNEDNVIELTLETAASVYFPDELRHKDLRGTVVNPPDKDGRAAAEVFRNVISSSGYDTDIYYTVRHINNEYKAYLCEARENCIGGEFKAATILKSIDDNLFFGAENGWICSFNFDMRDENGEISPEYYTFDGRTIYCGAATKMDNCGIPHLNKSTVKGSTVIKTKSFLSSAAKIKVRTNRKPYEQIARINSARFSFDWTDFSDFTFATSEHSIFAVKEKEKKWVEKQYYIYSDEYRKPFALYYVSYRYNVSGRYKEK